MTQSSEAPRKRPISPFMIGPYYRPQLTSMTSIMHRISGVLLAAGTVLLLYWLCATASGPQEFARFLDFVTGPLGTALMIGASLAMIYHLLNGLRHLFWDAGWGLEIKKAYASGWTVIILTLVATTLLWALIFRGGV